nr:receptor-like protein 7 [Ziziphus jujuba var. spinosa]
MRISLCLAVLLHLFLKLSLLCEIVVSDNYSFASSYKQPSCHEDEKWALWQFKESFVIDKYASSDEGAYPKVLQWNKNASNCCLWNGIQCDEETGHVIGLDLSSSCLFGSINSNSTLFNLLHLRRLNLADNNFNYSQIPSAIRQFPGLIYLNLSHSRFFGQVPIEISYLSKLATLDLSVSLLGDSEERFLKLRNPILSNLTNIQVLHLGSVDMSSAVPVFLKNFSSLVSLNLENCNLYGEFPVEIFRLPNLEFLVVRLNENLTGYLPEFHQNSHLKCLNILSTRFSGTLPSSIENLHSLETFNAERCQFSGPIPPALGKLTKLTRLDLRENSLSGYIPSSLQNLTRLNYLGLDANQKSDPILSWIGNLTQLDALFLHQNELHGTVPESLSKLKNLKLLSLDANNFGEMVKFDVFYKMESLSMLYLININLSFQFEKGNMNASFPKFKHLLIGDCNLIEFPDFLRHQSKLESLILVENMLQGPLPIPPPSIKVFDVSDNMLSGEISPLYCNLSSLVYLALSRNNLSGEIPACFENSSRSLSVINLGKNFFHGIIPKICKNGGNLAMLDLSDNKLQGQLPRSLSNCKKLEGLLVSKNQLIDVFPSWLRTLPYLSVLTLNHNGFYGAIGKVEFTKLQVMDLSFNNFVGELPSEYISSLNSMKATDMISKTRTSMNFMISYHVTEDLEVYFTSRYQVEVTLKGREMLTTIQNNFAFIDLSSNKFEGEIPELVGNLTALCSLNLSNNMLTGHIPTSLGNLKKLECLDLSNNNLSGKIPQQLNQLAFLAYLNVSYNNLIGPIPQGTQFNTFESSSFEGNLGLCGKPLLNQCENMQALPPSHATFEDQELESPLELDRKFVWVGILSGLVVGGVLGDTVTRRNRAWTRLMKKFRWMLQERF